MRAPARRPPPLRLRLTGGPVAEQLAGVRREVARWGEAVGLPELLVEDLVLAVHEALANVADHAYRDGAGDAWLDMDCAAGALEVTVRDRGAWKEIAADPGWRGRGLMIIRGLADDVELHHDDGGTSVRMRWRLG